ncbi:MAG: flagellin [Chloroflexi bacterium]|nr:flagellin [Chloroflexota bacterium]
MRINHNLFALDAQRNLTLTQMSLSKSVERLSSGLRINRAADDAAGLSISEKLRAQVNGLAQASRNAQDAISMIQTAEGGLNEVHAMLQRMRELAVQASNDTLSDADRANIKSELQQLLAEVNHIGDSTEFNGKKLLDGSLTTTGTGPANFQIGATASDAITVEFKNVKIDTTANGADTAMDALNTALSNFNATSGQTVANAQALITAVDGAITFVNSVRSTLGAYQNRLEHTIANLGVSHENLSASESRIRDADIAEEMANFTRNQILQQAGTAILAQANQVPQGVLTLLR